VSPCPPPRPSVGPRPLPDRGHTAPAPTSRGGRRVFRPIAPAPPAAAAPAPLLMDCLTPPRCLAARPVGARPAGVTGRRPASHSHTHGCSASPSASPSVPFLLPRPRHHKSRRLGGFQRERRLPTSPAPCECRSRHLQGLCIRAGPRRATRIGELSPRGRTAQPHRAPAQPLARRGRSGKAPGAAPEAAGRPEAAGAGPKSGAPRHRGARATQRAARAARRAAPRPPLPAARGRRLRACDARQRRWRWRRSRGARRGGPGGAARCNRAGGPARVQRPARP
jgi:hypothetical protein